MEQFHKVKEEFAAITEELEKMRKKLSSQTRQIQFLERNLRKECSDFGEVGSRLNGTAERLERDELRLEQMLQQYSDTNKNLDQQIERIKDL